MFIKHGTVWKALDDVFVQIGGTWKQVQYGFISVLESGVMRWKQFFGENAPVVVTKPSIRTTNTSGSGTIYDGPLATSPQIINTDLFGKDGTYTNYTTISNRKFTYASTDTASIRTTLVNDDRFTSAGGVTTALRQAVDEQYLFYELNVSNATDTITPVSNPIKMIRDLTNAITFGWSDSETVGSTLFFNYSIQNEYYRRAEYSNSKIKWWRSSNTNPGGTLIKEETLSATGSSNGNTFDGLSYYTISSSDVNYYIVAEIVIVNSWTRHYGYTNGLGIASFPSAKIVVIPGNITDVRTFNFSGSNMQLFLTTGSNTSRIDYDIISNSIYTGYKVASFTPTVSSNTPYKFEHNLMNYFTYRTWNEDTYNAGSTYYGGNTVWYAGNNYTAKVRSFSGAGTAPSLSGSNTYWTRGVVVGYYPYTTSNWSSGATYTQGNTV